MPGLYHHVRTGRLLLSFLFLLALSGARAATLSVPSSQYPTIQSAIDAAAPGDTVSVENGTYTGAGNVDLDFGGKAITVTSAHGAAGTIIDCQGSSNVHRGFYFHSGETAAASLNGFTIENGNSPTDPDGYDSGSGITIIDGSSPTITHCTILGCRRNAVFINLNSNPTISDCHIRNNPQEGLRIDLSNPTITRCDFTDNQTEGLLVLGCNPTITNCAFVANGGSGLFLYNASPTFINCTVAFNPNIGLYEYYNNHAIFINCIFWGNGSEVIADDYPSPAFVYCDVQGGYAGTGNISVDPRFRPGGDFHLRADSPCLYAGTAAGAPTTDFDGSPRPSAPSIGAYEVAPPPRRFDFNDDGHSDLLWYNDATGDILTWTMFDDTADVYSYPFVTLASPLWTVAAAADVDGDGRPDLLWQNTENGKLLFWLTATAPARQKFAYGAPFAGVSDTDWHVVSLPDLDGDGHPDILWQNVATGQVLTWRMGGANGTTVLHTGTPFAAVSDTHWQIVGTADFNRDGHADLLWENSATGDLLIWNLGGSAGTSVLRYGAPFATVSNTAWRVVGTGDMDGDGHPDLLWQNRQMGQTLRWRMGGPGGTTVLSYGAPFAKAPDTHWHIVGLH